MEHDLSSLSGIPIKKQQRRS